MEKSAEAFRTISEVSELLNTPAHVLRFWESRFSQVKPVKRAGGRRYYRPADLALLGGIKQLLHEDGLTIRGVQKILREQGVKFVASLSKVDLPGTAEEVEAESASVAKAPPSAGDPSSGGEKHPWPGAPSPDAAEPDEGLQPDPDDVAQPVTAAPRPVPSTQRSTLSPGAERRAAMGREPSAPEAPMDVDVPTLPAKTSDNVHPLNAPQSAAARANATSPKDAGQPELPFADRRDAPGKAAQPPAAALLRAMDTLRARDKRSELKSVYLRLAEFRDRLSRTDPQRR